MIWPQRVGVQVCLSRASFLLACVALIGVTGVARADTIQPQVQIEVKFVEVSRDSAKNLGVSLADALAKLPADASKPALPGAVGLGPAPNADAVSHALFPATEPGTLNVLSLMTPKQMDKILDGLIHKSGEQVVTAPSVFIPSHQPAVIEVTPDYGGVDLHVTPEISPDRKTVGLKIVPLVTDVARTTLNTQFGNDGHRPGICDIPVLGGLFRDDEKAGPPQQLIIFVVPHVVDELGGGGNHPGDPVETHITGTGETIGHVADLKLVNTSNDSLIFVVPGCVLESASEENQDYVCPKQQQVKLDPHQSETVPMEGVCVNRDLPPAGKNVKDDLVINTGNPTVPTNCHNAPDEARDLIRFTQAKYDCVDQLQQQGELKDFPYKDKKEQKEILVQWSVWNDPEISDITESPVATKDDLKKVVYKQAEKHGPVTKDAKKKLDQGIDTIFEKVELTNEKAKDLEKPDPFADVELTGQKAKDQPPDGNQPNYSAPPAPAPPPPPPPPP